MNYALKQWDNAIRYYRIALKQEPNNLRIKTLLGLSYLNNSEIEDSQNVLQEVVLQDPSNQDAISGLGRIAAIKHDYVQAQLMYQKVLIKNPYHFTTLFYLGDLEIDLKHFAEAEEILRKLLIANPNAVWVKDALKRAELGPLLERATRLNEKGQFEEALNLLTQELDKSHELELYLAASKLYREAKKYPQAIALLLEGLKRYPDQNSLYLNLGFTHLLAFHLDEAEHIFNTILKGKGDHAEALAGLGRIAALKGDLEEEEKLYAAAYKLNPLSPLILSYLGEMKMQQEKYSEAEALFDEITRLDPHAIWAKKAKETAQEAPYLKIIQQQEDEGNFEKAKLLYENLIGRFPHRPYVYLRFASFYRRQKNYQKSIEVLLQGLKETSSSLELSLALAHDYRLQGEYEQSSAILEEMLKNFPRSAEVLAETGRLYADQGQEELASEYYQKALLIDSLDVTALSYSIDLAMKQKNYLKAEQLLSDLLKVNPQAEWAQNLLVRARFGTQFDAIEVLEKQGDVNLASLELKKLLALAPMSQDIYLDLGQIYRRLNRNEEAVEIYKKGLELLPGSSELRTNLGLTYLDMHDWERAQTQLEKALKQDPRNGDVLAALGKLYYLSGDKKKALQFYQRALKLSPTNVFVLSSLADYWMKEKEFDKAKELYEQIVKIDPGASWAIDNALSASYGPSLVEALEKENHKDYQAAEEIYKELLAAVPKKDIFYVKLGNLYLKAKKYAEAESIYQQGLNLLPQSIDLNNGLGFVYLAKNKIYSAKKAFEKVLALQPHNAEALAGIGRSYELSGNLKKAAESYQKALKYEPDNMTALVFLSDLLVLEGNFSDAKKIYKKIYTLDTKNNKWALLAFKDARYGKTLAEIKEKTKAKDYKAVEQLWEFLIKEEPNEIAYYLRFGLFYQYIKAYDKALDIFSAGIKIHPNSTELEAGLGLSYLSKKDLPNAEKAFNRALQLDPANPDALAGLGYVAFLSNDYSRAELLIKTALKIDPERIAALSSYGDLLLKQKKYKEAEAVYRKIIALRPEENVFTLSLEDAIYGTELDEIHELIKQNRFAQAAEKYTYLLQQSPNNVNFFYGLGQMYMRLHQYGKSIEVNLKGLEKNPESNALLIALGYDYFYNKHLVEARAALEQALSVDQKDPEALAGLGRIEALEKNFDAAECLYLYALKIDPKNISALSFYGTLLMNQKRYEEAQSIFANLWQILPDAVWVQQAWQDAVDGPVTNIANRLSNQEEFELAAVLFRDLVCSSPDDPARYLALGQTYANLQEYCRALAVYFEGLSIDSKNAFLWRGVAFTYILMEEFDAAQDIFCNLLLEDSEDTESWAGLGRIQALIGSYCSAEAYYAQALEIDPDNLTTLSFLSELYQNEGWNFSSFAINYRIGEILDSDPAFTGESWPKWALRSYNNALNLIAPTLFLSGSYHEEDQWDPTLHRWSAEYQVYGARALFRYALCDGFTVWGSFADQFYNLQDLISRNYFYSFDVQKFLVGSKWVYNSCFFIDTALGFTNFSPYKDSQFDGENGWIVEPSLVGTYHTPTSKATFGLTSSSDLVARNFSTNKAKMVGFYTFGGSYESRIMQRTWAGIQADFTLYNDYVNNTSEKVSGWIQWRPPCYTDNLLFRYYSKYQTFEKNIPDYYTYQPQFINLLQATLEKRWRVCWADTFYTSLTYNHGFQNTHTRFKQIIVVTPSLVQPPFSWDNRQFNTLIGNVIYKRGSFQSSLTADYYRDTQKYTMWTIAGELGWSF